MRVGKLGNSLAVHIPAAVVPELHLQAGSLVELRIAEENTLEISRSMTRDEALESLKAIGARLPKSYTFNREEANARS
jgi:antitoxin MazE